MLLCGEHGREPAEGAVIPGCNDTGTNGCMANEPDTPVKAWSIQGVDPAVAVLVRGRSNRQIFIKGFPFRDAPPIAPEVKRLLR